MKTILAVAATVAIGAAAVAGTIQPSPHSPPRSPDSNTDYPLDGCEGSPAAAAARSASTLVTGTPDSNDTPGLTHQIRPQPLTPISTQIIDTTELPIRRTPIRRTAISGTLGTVSVRVEVLVDARTVTGLMVAVPETVVVACQGGREVVSGAGP